MAQKPAKKFVSIAPFYQSKTPSRNAVFQNPNLVALGVEICEDYPARLNEAIESLVLRRQAEHEAQKAALYDELNAQIDREIEAEIPYTDFEPNIEEDDPRQGDVTVGEYARSLTMNTDGMSVQRRVAEYV